MLDFTNEDSVFMNQYTNLIREFYVNKMTGHSLMMELNDYNINYSSWINILNLTTMTFRKTLQVKEKKQSNFYRI
jgi:hypothetical protein